MAVVALEPRGTEIAVAPRTAQTHGSAVRFGRVTLMFTDVCDSTALFARLGDGAAFRLLHAHFGALVAIVHGHGGELVKTSGDGILASFAESADGVRAALAMQGVVRNLLPLRGGAAAPRLEIRIGLHVGAVLAATLNGRLDFYGSTVNLGARLLKRGEGGEIVLSQAVLGEAGVAAAIDAVPSHDEVAMLKGFAAPVQFRRLSPSNSLQPIPLNGVEP